MSHINLRTVVQIDKPCDSVCLLIYQILEILLFRVSPSLRKQTKNAVNGAVVFQNIILLKMLI